MEIAIIGAGIGGLTTALALKKAGISFKIYESADELKPVGAGIILAMNAMRVYSHLGMADKIARNGNRISVINLTKPNFDKISSNDLVFFEKQFNVSTTAIHRADLHRVLAEEVGMEHIILGKRLQRIIPIENNHRLEFEDGTSAEAQYLIGADGIRSVVRTLLFPESEYRDAGQWCWRGVVDNIKMLETYRHGANEAWGKGTRFGFVRLNDRQLYWYFLADKDMAEADSDIMPFLKEYHPSVLQIIKSTPKENWFVSPIMDLKPIQQWSLDKVCLIGDAAHATTPNLGQGACQAIEDAYVLGKLLQKHSINEAFRLYPLLRKKKAHAVVNMSWKIGKLSHLRNPLMIAFRNFVMRTTPDYLNRKQLEKLFALEKKS
ncbi:2-polyprenyl-6-methoxyphenol hydroxylase-like FAD-dependent oxidoreductase [Flavobacterium sp. 28YEA47A]|uniref:FAD-dependent monooxygenase n=1 Tax=Flavobacterium sp. 28YEA47A TaxID=3156276 RepID=UPI00351253FF